MTRQRIKPLRSQASMRLATLVQMHTYCRPMGSKTEREFTDLYLATLPNVERDEFGNFHVTVPGDDVLPVLWSCHTDTVHSKEGRQLLDYNARTGRLQLARAARRAGSSCLGADDTAGVFLLRELVLAGKPGHYIFHYGEERGGVGSRQLAEHMPVFVEGFQCAIALDRQGTTDVITHQGCRQTASDEFALSLAAGLGMGYKPSSHGIYTDTAEYAELVPECTNVSIGYQHAHTSSETLDTWHVLRLLDSLLALNTSALTIARNPALDPWGDWALWDDDELPDYSAPVVQDVKVPWLDPEWELVQRALMSQQRKVN